MNDKRNKYWKKNKKAYYCSQILVENEAKASKYTKSFISPKEISRIKTEISKCERHMSSRLMT